MKGHFGATAVPWACVGAFVVLGWREADEPGECCVGEGAEPVGEEALRERL